MLRILIIFPGHALREKGLHRQLGVGTQVSSQERRAAVVPWISRGSTRRFVAPSVNMGFSLLVLQETRPAGFLRSSGGYEGTLSPWADRPVGVPSCPAPPRPPVPRCAAPSRPARGMSGFWIRQIITLVTPIVVIIIVLVVKSKLIPSI